MRLTKHDLLHQQLIIRHIISHDAVSLAGGKWSNHRIFVQLPPWVTNFERQEVELLTIEGFKAWSSSQVVTIFLVSIMIIGNKGNIMNDSSTSRFCIYWTSGCWRQADTGSSSWQCLLEQPMGREVQCSLTKDLWVPLAGRRSVNEP